VCSYGVANNCLIGPAPAGAGPGPETGSPGALRGCGDRPEIVGFGGLGGPGRPINPPKRSGAKPPTFLEGFPASRGRPDPQHRRFPVAQNTAPDLLGRFLGRPGPPRPPKINDFRSVKKPRIKNPGVYAFSHTLILWGLQHLGIPRPHCWK